MSDSTRIHAPGYLCRVVSEEHSGKACTRGSGILIGTRWMLTARHVVHRRQKLGARVEWEESAQTLRVQCQGGESGIEEIIPDPHGDIALVRLGTELPGPCAILLTGLQEPDCPARASVPLTYIGYRAEADVGAPPTVGPWMTDYMAQWNAETGGAEDWRFSIGAPAGLSGGPVCADLDQGLGVAGLLYLGGEPSATSRAYAVPRLLGLLAPVPGLEVRRYPIEEYTRELRSACIQVLQHALVGWCPDAKGLLADSFFGYQHDPQGELVATGAPADLARQWVDKLLGHRRLDDGRHPLARLIRVAYCNRQTPTPAFDGGYDGLLRALESMR